MYELVVCCLASPVVKTIRFENKPDGHGCNLETCGPGLIGVVVGFHPMARNLYTEFVIKNISLEDAYVHAR